MTISSELDDFKVLPFPDLNTHDDGRDERLQEYMIKIIDVAIRTLNARLMILIALLGAVVMWGFIAIEPNLLKIVCGACYSIGVLLPVLFSFSKKS